MNRKWNVVNRQNYGVWAVGLSLIAGLAVRAAWSALPPIGPIDNLPVLVSAPIANTLATARGCRTGNFGLNQILPEWVSVQPADLPLIAEGVVRKSHVSSEEAPNSHFSHDQN